MSYRERQRSRSRDRDDYHDGRGRESNHRENYSRDGDRYRDQQGYLERERRDRDYTRNNDRDYHPSKNISVEESKTVILRGLPAHTTEPSLYAVLAPYMPQEIRLIAQRDTGDCKGFAFVEFYSIEHASYFMTTFAGSSGDPNAPQLIIDNRAVVLDYARDRDRDRDRDHKERGSRFGGSAASGEDRRPIKSDWICEKCSCQNFARRNECYRCSAPKTDTCVLLNSGPGNPGGSSASSSDSFTDTVVSTQTPNCYLAVRGLPPYVSEEQVTELFRQYAPVKGVLVVRDRVTGMSRGLALVEFHSTEHCSHALHHAEAAKLSVDHGGAPLKISYAKPAFVTQQVTQLHEMQMQQAALAYGTVPAAAWAAVPVPTPMPVPTPASVVYATAAVPGYVSTSIPMSQPPVTAPDAAQRDNAPSLQPSPKPRVFYPPNFETNGGVYVFQPQSGYFYDSLSEYYYCPKSKLYYNSKDGTYYRYEVGADPPYVRFIPPAPSEAQPVSSGNNGPSITETSSDANNTLDVAAVASAALARKPVIISMGLGASKQKPAKPVAPNKKILENIAKWESAQEDAEEEDAPGNEEAVGSTESASAFGKHNPAQSSLRPRADSSAIATAPVANSAPPESSAEAVSNPSSATTSAGGGGAVCLLCRRQFASGEQLLRHERESKLHAENLAKQAASGVSSSTQYRDRASERRAVQGVGIAPGTRNPSDNDPRQRRQSFDAPSIPPDMTIRSLKEDNTNLGSQLLRKMGWNDGQGLGKDSSGIENPIEAVGRTGSKAGVGSADSSLPPLVYGPGNAYKESLLRAAKARYDQIDK